MITAKDINTKRFEQAKPGYKPEEVDDFLRELAAQIDADAREREDTDKKIEVLVESVRKYKSDEEALKDALIGAQKQARAVIAEAQDKAQQIVAEAQQKAEQIISAANVKSDEIIGSTSIRAEKAKAELEKVQKEVTSFKSKILDMYRAHLELITSVPEYDFDEEEEAPAKAEDTADVQASAPASEAEDAQKPAVDMEATRVIDSSTIVFDSPEDAVSHLSK
ncbi:MAG: DivIVA domain-containing protein [Huintestinicola sp.]